MPGSRLSLLRSCASEPIPTRNENVRDRRVFGHLGCKSRETGAVQNVAANLVVEKHVSLGGLARPNHRVDHVGRPRELQAEVTRATDRPSDVFGRSRLVFSPAIETAAPAAIWEISLVGVSEEGMITVSSARTCGFSKPRSTRSTPNSVTLHGFGKLPCRRLSAPSKPNDTILVASY